MCVGRTASLACDSETRGQATDRPSSRLSCMSAQTYPDAKYVRSSPLLASAAGWRRADTREALLVCCAPPWRLVGTVFRAVGHDGGGRYKNMAGRLDDSPHLSGSNKGIQSNERCATEASLRLYVSAKCGRAALQSSESPSKPTRPFNIASMPENTHRDPERGGSPGVFYLSL